MRSLGKIDKDSIISEIHRVTKKCDGKAPGQAAFASETGIGVHTWKGIHWARWSDALSEAGYAPNAYVQAISHDALMNSLSRFVTELGRLPVLAEYKMRRQHDPDFPSYDVYRNRFGGMVGLTNALHEYSLLRGDSLVATICAERSTDKVKDVDRATVEPNAVGGYVYLLKSGRYYKIGKSNSVGRREYEIGIQMPEEVKRIHVIATDDPNGIETYWHNRFRDKRHRGEWFDLNAEDIAAFKRRKFM